MTRRLTAFYCPALQAELTDLNYKGIMTSCAVRFMRTDMLPRTYRPELQRDYDQVMFML